VHADHRCGALGHAPIRPSVRLGEWNRVARVPHDHTAARSKGHEGRSLLSDGRRSVAGDGFAVPVGPQESTEEMFATTAWQHPSGLVGSESATTTSTEDFYGHCSCVLRVS
jgi:hypothetical protein